MSKVFKDVGKAGKDRQWRERKLAAIQYARALEQLGYRRFKDTYICANVLKYLRQTDGSLRLHEAYFCQDKLCPICSWRRSMKNSAQNSRIIDEALRREPKARFVFLTLSARNVWNGTELNAAMSELTGAFNRMFQRAKVKQNLLGWIRATEVTVSDDDEKPEWRGSYNQHLHILMMVKNSYFKNSNSYIPATQWRTMWRQSLRADYDPIVDVRIVRPKKKGGDMRSAILETSKYPVKPIRYDLSDEKLMQVSDLKLGLERKRQLAYGGLLRKIKRELGLEDVETSHDLIHVDAETGEVLGGEEVVAMWNWERKNYYLQ
jgi:plasmid rolling circle replication initiator protein Rep